MSHVSWLRTAVATCAAALISSAAMAGAVTVDFESVVDDPSNFGIGGLYFGGDMFTQNGFRMFVDYDAATVDVDTGAGPTGNSSTFYTQLNQGGLLFFRDDTNPFSLLSFDAGAVPQQGSTATNYIAALALDPTLTTLLDVEFFQLPTTGFASFSPAGTGLNNVYAIEFLGCYGTAVGPVSCGSSNNLQFALDNVRFDVPEPGALSLSLLAVAGVAVSRRRRNA